MNTNGCPFKLTLKKFPTLTSERLQLRQGDRQPGRQAGKRRDRQTRGLNHNFNREHRFPVSPNWTLECMVFFAQTYTICKKFNMHSSWRGIVYTCMAYATAIWEHQSHANLMACWRPAFYPSVGWAVGDGWAVCHKITVSWHPRTEIAVWMWYWLCRSCIWDISTEIQSWVTASLICVWFM